MLVNQADMSWVLLEEPRRSKPAYIYPHVVIQDNVINRGRVTKDRL